MTCPMTRPLMPPTRWLCILLLPAAVLGCARPDVSLRAPARVEQALAVVTDLGATATLVRSGGRALGDHELSRGDDGVTFSGFVDAEPGTYTLEIVFTGVPAAASERHFLARLTSDSFTVTQGESTTPAFTRPIDTVGREGDGGDDDSDGLGFLDELLLETDLAAADSDNDGLLDGVDCVPTNGTSTFEIVEGGTFEDCDADGYRAVTSPLGDPGQDCDDENGDVNPSIDDDCTNSVDQDCNPQTCPIADFDGPEITIVSPADGATIGCNTPFVVEATDPSDVTGVNMTTPNNPLAGGTPRTTLLTADGDDLTWRAANGFGSIGSGLTDGPLAVDVTAFDTAANQNTIHASYTLVSAFPEVTMTGPSSIIDGPPVSITVTPQGGRTLVSLQLRAAPFNPTTTLVDIAAEQVLGSLPVGGGSLDVDPADLPSNAVVYPVAVDDVGNTAGPSAVGTSFSPTFGVNASFFCDGANHYVPAISKRGDVSGPVTLLAHLQEAIDIATGIDPTAFLTQVIGFGVGADGLVDLSRTDSFSTRVAFMFMTPAAITNGEDSIRIDWLSAAFTGTTNPVIDLTGSFQTDQIANPAGLLDSDVVAAQFSCGGTGLLGRDDDFVMYTRDVDGAIPGTDQVAVFTQDDYSWTTDATDLAHPEGFCCTPTGCT